MSPLPHFLLSTLQAGYPPFSNNSSIFLIAFFSPQAVSRRIKKKFRRLCLHVQTRNPFAGRPQCSPPCTKPQPQPPPPPRLLISLSHRSRSIDFRPIGFSKQVWIPIARRRISRLSISPFLRNWVSSANGARDLAVLRV
jgi:hypothetical protein